MRGTFFQKPLEISIDIDGETWSQGDTVKGHLEIKSHSDQEVDLSSFEVSLVYTDHKKMLKKERKGLEVLNVHSLGATSVSDKNPFKCDFLFNLESNSPVSQKSKGIFLLCGDKSDPFECVRLELPIRPQQTILNFIEIFENFHRFKTKAIKNKKGSLEFKMQPPDSKGLGGIEDLLLLIKEENKRMILKYQFKIRRLAHGSAGVNVENQKVEIDQELENKQYLAFGGSPNQEGINLAIKTTLEQVKSKFTF